MSYNKSVAYFKWLENLEKIRRINGTAPLPVDNQKPVVCSTVGVAVGKKNPQYGRLQSDCKGQTAQKWSS
jgi:hypothetical protein